MCGGEASLQGHLARDGARYSEEVASVSSCRVHVFISSTSLALDIKCPLFWFLLPLINISEINYG